MIGSLKDWLSSLRRLDPSALVYTAAVAAFLGLSLWVDPWIHGDSYSYLNNAPTRTALYPLYLDVVQTLLGDGFARPAICFQVLAVAIGAHRFAWGLRQDQNLSAPAGCGVAVVLLLPLLRYGSMILPECLAYALFLWFVAVLLHGLVKPLPRALVSAAALGALLVLTRPQYLYLYPVLALYAAGHVALAQAPARRGMALAAGLGVLVLVGGSLTQQVYNDLVNGRFSQVSYTGIQLLGVQLYLANPADLRFEDPDQQRFADAASRVIEEQQLATRYSPPRMPEAGFFVNAFGPLVFQGIVAPYEDLFHGGQRLDADGWAALDRMSISMALHLARANPVRYVKHMAREVYQTERFFFVLTVTLPVVAFCLWVARRDPWFGGIALVGVAAWANYAVVLLVQSMLVRYSYAQNEAMVALVLATLLRRPATAGHESRP
jgi:hypothetical protein